MFPPNPPPGKIYNTNEQSAETAIHGGNKEQGCLKRAWTRFKQRVAPLSATLGHMIRPVKPTAAQLWKQLRRKSNLEVILLELAQPFNTSLLHDS